MPIEAKMKLAREGVVSIDGDRIEIARLVDGADMGNSVLFNRDELPELIKAIATLTRWADEADGKAAEPAPAQIEPETPTTALTREELDRMRAEAPPADMSVADLTDVQIAKLRSVIETTTTDGERNVYLTPGDPRRWIDAFEAMTGRLRYMNNGAFKLGTYGELWIEEAGTDLSHVETPFKRQYDPEVMERG